MRVKGKTCDQKGKPQITSLSCSLNRARIELATRRMSMRVNITHDHPIVNDSF